MTHSDTDPAVNPEPRLPVNSPGLTAGGFSDKLRVLDLFSGIGGSCRTAPRRRQFVFEKPQWNAVVPPAE